ncbi:MAG: LysM peptidoglycan-binding domain-containing protein [Phycisphaerales bacterium]|nr:LysM peptidoglycan-binding domain-containing protein [Phycisphaerales bacterium]MCB9862027.1 LysM peptidoglycan-binding domain-containing protein [Phycisphaerales bacterium]
MTRMKFEFRGFSGRYRFLLRRLHSHVVSAFAVIILLSGCSDSAASRERARTRAVRTERERPLTVATRADGDRSTSSRTTRRPTTARRNSGNTRAHIDPTPAGYDDSPAKASAPVRAPLRRVEPETSKPTNSAHVTPTNDTSAPPAAVAAAPETGMRVYHVQRGDTLWSLANKFYGDSKHWRRILAANRNRVPDPRDLPVGIKLIIP